MTQIVATPELLADPPDGMINSYGSLLKLDPRDSLFLGSHDYEPYETKLAIGLCRPGDVTVDVGAMIGYYTLLFAHNVGPDGRVYSFEPDPSNFELLSENVSVNGYSHVQVKQAIVGAETGRSRLFRAPEEFRGDNRAYGTAGDRESVEVDVVALDDVVDEPVNVVKIDVQGYEGHVLAGMRGLVERSRELAMLVELSPILLEEAGTDPGQFLADVRGLGFALFEIDEDAGQMRGTDAATLLASARDDDTGAYSVRYTNLLCVKSQR